MQQQEADNEDGTPLVEVIDESNIDFQDIYEHRSTAKQQSQASIFFETNPLNNSSFSGLLLGPGQSQLLYSKSSERDRAVLE